MKKKIYYWKIIKANYCGLGGIPYHLGENLFLDKVHDNEKEMPKMIYYTDIKHIFAYLNYGPLLCKCTIPIYAKSYFSPESMYLGGELIPAYHTSILNIVQFYNLTKIPTIKMLIKEGADITVDNYHIFKHALMYNNKLYNWLVKNYPEHYEQVKEILLEY